MSSVSSDIGNCLLSDTPTSSLRDPEDIVQVQPYSTTVTVVILCKALVLVVVRMVVLVNANLARPDTSCVFSSRDPDKYLCLAIQHHV